jgi:hypothetical protein
MCFSIFRDVDSVRRAVLLIYPPILLGLIALAYDVLLNRSYQGVVHLLNVNWEALLSFDVSCCLITNFNQ